ncbi:LuxR C-terminal-related transcriptional regulator [Amycolatopsis sp. NPDC021455]|uniref:helix-turn-helix transcriptional regulator n=1 Tax=Amycolatopsis sp. NPDC021455 TaxID=3154901 RepID=UPI0033E164C3
MIRDCDALPGRSDEVAAIEKVAGRPVLVVVRGAAGAGKTAVLGAVRQKWLDRGMKILHVSFSLGAANGDEFGIAAVLTAFRDEFGARCEAKMAALKRLSVPDDTGCSPSGSTLFTELTRLFGALRQHGPAAVVFDDLHAVPNPGFTVAAARHAGCTVLATCREDETVEPTLLTALADQVVDLGPLPDGEIDELIAARGPVDPAVAPAVREALGSLAGNPGAVLGTWEELRRTGRLVPVRGVLCLAAPDAPIALPAGHAFVRRIGDLPEPATELVALVATAGRFRVDDLLALAEAAGWEPPACGRAADRLVAAGVLGCDEPGTLFVTSPALAAAVLRALGEQRVRALHGMLAEHLLREPEAWPAESALVADHVALAGPELRAGPAAVALLCREAAGVLPADPASAARWYRATPAAGRTPDLTRSLLRLLVRIGRYDWLGEAVAETVAAGVPAGLEDELAVVAALAALHTGLPVPPAVADALAGRAPLVFTARWFDGREPLCLDELLSAFGSFRLGAPPDLAPARDQLGIWCGRHDLVALFGFLFGDEYGAPEGGPLALYHRVITGYHRGDWADVLSASRALELSGRTGTPVHCHARLLTAEILSCEGEFELAAAWLEAGERCPLPAMVTWARTGLLWRSGRLPEAIEAGWRGYERAAEAAERGNVVGLHWLLVRLAMLEAEADHPARLLELHALARKWYARYGGRRLRMAELMVTGLAERDLASARTAVEVVRGHANQSDLMRACLIASFVADEPRPWLHEAYDIARRLGGDLLRMGIKARMRERGVPLPRQHLASDDLSATEVRIIALIRDGLTNRQIAGTMRISEKTVESHLTRLFAKTGCRSRLDLATASIEGRLTVSGLDRSGTA